MKKKNEIRRNGTVESNPKENFKYYAPVGHRAAEQSTILLFARDIFVPVFTSSRTT